MSILTTFNVSKEFGPEEIFSGITVEVPHKARVALVGPNGAGKTTLLNILYGSEPPTSGNCDARTRDAHGFSATSARNEGEHTVYEEQISGLC
ncbi:MAG: ATP-binding cassette domain-containing protein [Anaerolineae bacterium]